MSPVFGSRCMLLKQRLGPVCTLYSHHTLPCSESTMLFCCWQRVCRWGCVLRVVLSFDLATMQTLASWFRLNAYTTRPEPTHRQIQQAVVDVGCALPVCVFSTFLSRSRISSTHHVVVIVSYLGRVCSSVSLSACCNFLSVRFTASGTRSSLLWVPRSG